MNTQLIALPAAKPPSAHADNEFARAEAELRSAGIGFAPVADPHIPIEPVAA